MSEGDRTSEATRWLRFAREDLAAAETLQVAGGTPRNACFCAQQAAEKGMKSVLVFEGSTVPRVHDLDALRNMIPVGWRFRDEFPQLGRLTRWIVVGRYPGDWPEPTPDEAVQAISQARALLAAITRDLAQRGLSEERGASNE